MLRLGLGFISFVLLILGCSCQLSTDSHIKIEQNEQQEPITLTILTTTDWMFDGTLQELFDAYQQKSGNRIQVQAVPGGQRFEEIIQAKIATQDYPDLLIYIPINSYIELLQPQKNFVDLTNEPYVDRLLPEVRKHYGSSGDKVYGIPVTGLAVNSVFYNKDVFRKAGINEVPVTWEEFIEACEKIRQLGITPVYEAGGDKWPLMMFSLMGLSGVLRENPEIIDQINQGDLKFSDVPHFKNILQMQLDLKQRGFLNDNLFSGTYLESLELLSSGQAGMMFQTDFFIPQLRRGSPDAEIGAFPFPDGNNRVVTYSFPYEIFILNETKYLAQAKELLSFISEPDTLNDYYQKVQTVPAWTGVKMNLDAMLEELRPFMDKGLTQFRLSELTGITMWSEYPSLLIDMLGGNKTPQEVMKSMDVLFELDLKP